MGALEALSGRERALVVGVGVALLALLVWLLAWRPMAAAEERLARQLESEAMNLEWMRTAAWEVERLREEADEGGRIDRGNLSLLALAEQSARSAGLGSAFRRGEPAGSDGVRVWLEGAAFDRTLRWLETLERTYGIRLEDGSLDRSGVPGLVNARLLLSESR